MMRRETPFWDLYDDLIIVEAVVRGRGRHAFGRFVLDTGAAVTTIIPQIAASIGYSAGDGFKRTRVHTAIGAETGYVLRVAEFAALGFMRRNFAVNVFALG